MNPATTPAEGSSLNKTTLFIGLGIAGAAACVGLALWASKTRVKRPRKPRNEGIKGQTGASRNSAQTARITLEEAAGLPTEQLLAELTKAQAENDIASQINLLYIIGAHLVKGEGDQVTMHNIANALGVYEQALEMAEQMNSEMVGPIQVEIAILYCGLQKHAEAMDRFEAGLSHYVRVPAGDKQTLNARILFQFFMMLNECYYTLKEYRRGIEFLSDFVEKIALFPNSKELVSALLLNVGEYQLILEQYDAALDTLLRGNEHADSPDLELAYNYNLGKAYLKLNRSEEGNKRIQTYLLAAEASDPIASLMNSYLDIIQLYMEVGAKDEARSVLNRAIEQLRTMSVAEDANLALKNYYILGIFSANKLQMYEKSAELLRKAVEIARNNPDPSIPWIKINCDLADVFTNMKQRQQALELFDESIRAWPESEENTLPPMLIKLARLYSELGNKTKTVEILKRTLSITENTSPELRLDAKQEENRLWLQGFLNFQLGKIYTLMGHLSTGERYLTAATEFFADSSDMDMKTMITAALASCRVQAGNKAKAATLLNEVLGLCSSSMTKDMLSQAEIRTETGEIYTFFGELRRAREEFLLGLEACKTESNARSSFAAMIRLAALCDLQGEPDKATEQLEEAQKQADDEQSVIQLGSIAIAKAHHHLCLGEIEQALAHAAASERYLDRACCGFTPLSILSYHSLLAAAQLWRGDLEKALENCDFCLRHMTSSDEAKENLVLNIDTTLKIAYLLLHVDERTEAVLQILEDLLPVVRANGSPQDVAKLLVMLTLARGKAGKETDDAYLVEASAVLRDLNDKRLRAILDTLTGVFYSHYSAQKDFEKASQLLEGALAALREMRDRLNECLALRALAGLAHQQGDRAEEDRLTFECSALAETIGAKFIPSLGFQQGAVGGGQPAPVPETVPAQEGPASSTEQPAETASVDTTPPAEAVEQPRESAQGEEPATNSAEAAPEGQATAAEETQESAPASEQQAPEPVGEQTPEPVGEQTPEQASQ